jgi:hypothetical protein
MVSSSSNISAAAHPAACVIRAQALSETVMVKKLKWGALEGMNIGEYEY